jgi:hypothetical protein
MCSGSLSAITPSQSKMMALSISKQEAGSRRQDADGRN